MQVQSQQLVTSYAIPPQCYLCCPPYSSYSRATRTSPAQRRTYLVTKEGTDDRKRRLIYFTERVRSKRTVDNEFSTPQKIECRLPDGDIASLEIVPSPTSEGQHILITYNDGSIVSVSGDLSKVNEQGRFDLDNNAAYTVEYATTIDAHMARRGLLKSREDVVATLDQMGTEPLLQCRVILTNTVRQFQLYSIENPNRSSLQSLKLRVVLLISYDLPVSGNYSSTDVQYELYAASGTLYQRMKKTLSILDLSGTTPKLITRLGGSSSPVTSFTRVSATSVASVSGERATLYETKYGSMQGSVSLTPMSPETQAKKRKREDRGEQSATFTLISSMSDLGLLVALSGNELVALQLDDALRKNKRVKTRSTLLAEVMGKGSLKEPSSQDKAKKKAKKWAEWTAEVDRLIEADDIEGLEKLVANDDRLGKQRKDERTHETGVSDDIPDGDRAAIEQLWPLPQPFDPQDLDRQKVLYILGNMFANVDSQNEKMEIAIPSSKLLEWLALTGFLSVARVQKAFTQVMPDDGLENLARSGDIMSAIRPIDNDFQLTHHLLSLPVHWEVGEVVQALRLVVKSFDPEPTSDCTLALPTPPQANGNMVDGDANSQLQLESEAAEHELEYAMTALTTGLEVRSDTLRVIFARLHAFHQPLVTSTMRAMMSHRDLVYFVHILRIELADGGWTSKYVDGGEADDAGDGMVNPIGGFEESGPNDEAIKVVGDLLNCAVDAIGTSGWLVGLGSSALGTAELLASLRAEASAALEGCQEANMLQASLAEIERFVASNEQAYPMGAKRTWEEEDEVDPQKALLPVGGRVQPPFVKGKNDQGGKKSKIALAQEKSRGVGKYSFERIRI